MNANSRCLKATGTNNTLTIDSNNFYNLLNEGVVAE